MPNIAVVGHRWPAVTSSAGQLLLSKSDFLYHKDMTTFLNDNYRCFLIINGSNEC